MKQLVFDFYNDMLEEENTRKILKASIINACYEKQKYPRSLEDITVKEFKDIFGESVYSSYKKDEEREKRKKGHWVILRECKISKESMSIKKTILVAGRGYQGEMICDIIASCLAIPEEFLHKCVFEQNTIRKISQVFKYSEGGVKLRLIKYYYDNVIAVIEKCEE